MSKITFPSPAFNPNPLPVPHAKPCKHCPSAHGESDPEADDILTWDRKSQVETVFVCGWNGSKYCKGYCDKLDITPEELIDVHNRRYAVETQFKPKWRSAPGGTIRDIMDEKRISDEYVMGMLGLSAEGLTALINGDMEIDDSLAGELSELFGASKEFWIRREFHFREPIGEEEV